jgi:hypothetical protein
MEIGHVTSRLTMLLDTFSMYCCMSSEKLLRYVIKDTVCKLRKNQFRKGKGTLRSGFKTKQTLSKLLGLTHNLCKHNALKGRPVDSKSKNPDTAIRLGGANRTFWHMSRDSEFTQLPSISTPHTRW